jgi:hypothetical protein
MTNLTIKEQEHILKHLNYDLRIAKQELDGLASNYNLTLKPNDYAKYCKLNIEKFKNEIEFLTNLINKL